MIALVVAMLDKFVHRLSEIVLTDRNDPIEAFLFIEPFTTGVQAIQGHNDVCRGGGVFAGRKV
jgi:hypothetical protein